MCTKSPEPTKDSKRVDYLSWSEYFMLVAKAAAMRSKDPATQVGCVIVNINNVIVGTGYNGFPVGCSDDELPWSKGHSDPLQNKHTYVVHAELNAIMNKIGDNLQGCTLYTTLFPCNECAKIIIQARIAKVVFESDREDWPFRAAKKLFDAVNPPIVYEKYCPAERQITITL